MNNILWLIGIAIVAWWAFKPNKNRKSTNVDNDIRVADNRWKRENKNRRLKSYLPNGQEVTDQPRQYYNSKTGNIEYH